MALRSGSLFSGAAGLDHAVEAVFGARPAWFVENDPAASRILAHHYLDTPNHGDVTRVGLSYTDDEWASMKALAESRPDIKMPEPDWGTVDRVALLTIGFPCTDVSQAGKRAGLRPGTRSGLWEHATYAIAQLQPGYIVIENVRGLCSACASSEMGQCPGCVGDREHRPFLRALGRVLGDLDDLGYDAVWCGLPASAVGAPHGRFRIFILAWRRAFAADADSQPGQQWRPRRTRRSGGLAAIR